MTMNTLTAPNSEKATPPALGSVTLSVEHARVLVDILKRTSRASSIENDWILHTIDTLAAQLARKH